MVRVIDRDASLIRRVLRERDSGEAAAEEGDENVWDEGGMIPLILERVSKHVPVKNFIYNTLLDCLSKVSVQQAAKKFVETKGYDAIEKIYTAKKELSNTFFGDQRVFYSVP